MNLLSIIPTIVEKHAELSKEVELLKSSIKTEPNDSSKAQSTSTYEEAIAEFSLRKKKENNLVIYGLDTLAEKAKATVEEMCVKELSIDLKGHLKRVTKGQGDSKMIFLQFTDLDTKFCSSSSQEAQVVQIKRYEESLD